MHKSIINLIEIQKEIYLKKKIQKNNQKLLQ